MGKNHGNCMQIEGTLKCKPNINRSLGNPSSTELLMREDCVLLIEINDPKLLVLQISKMWLKEVINRLATVELYTLLWGLLMPSHKFKSCCEPCGFGKSNAMKFS